MKNKAQSELGCWCLSSGSRGGALNSGSGHPMPGGLFLEPSSGSVPTLPFHNPGPWEPLAGWPTLSSRTSK